MSSCLPVSFHGRNDWRQCIAPSLLTLSHACHRLSTHLTKATIKVGISRHRLVSCPQIRVVPNKAAKHQQTTAQPGSCSSARATCTAQACLEADSRVIASHCTFSLGGSVSLSISGFVPFRVPFSYHFCCLGRPITQLFDIPVQHCQIAPRFFLDFFCCSPSPLPPPCFHDSTIDEGRRPRLRRPQSRPRSTARPHGIRPLFTRSTPS